MSDNKKVWTAALYVLAVSYTAYCIFIFGSLLASEPDTLGALLKFADTYGTIITGAPVLVAVVVAKQQMDANRRQHVATIKYNLRKEIGAIEKLREFADSLLKAHSVGSITAFSQRGLAGIPIFPPTESEIRKIESQFDNDLWIYAEICRIHANTAINFQYPPMEGATERALSNVESSVRRLLDRLDEEQRRLSQYWS